MVTDVLSQYIGTQHRGLLVHSKYIALVSYTFLLHSAIA